MVLSHSWGGCSSCKSPLPSAEEYSPCFAKYKPTGCLGELMANGKSHGSFVFIYSYLSCRPKLAPNQVPSVFSWHGSKSDLQNISQAGIITWDKKAWKSSSFHQHSQALCLDSFLEAYVETVLIHQFKHSCSPFLSFYKQIDTAGDASETCTGT